MPLVASTPIVDTNQNLSNKSRLAQNPICSSIKYELREPKENDRQSSSQTYKDGSSIPGTQLTSVLQYQTTFLWNLSCTSSPLSFPSTQI
jgi:hypothetical protein